MHANYPTPQLDARGVNGLYHAELQQNFFTLPQIVTSSWSASGWGGRRWAAYAFTEQGVAMLSSVLRSHRATAANIAIMRAFVRLREMVAANAELAKKLDQLERRVSGHDQAITSIVHAIRELAAPPDPKPKRRIGFVSGD
jgi:hypothetical protein